MNRWYKRFGKFRAGFFAVTLMVALITACTSSKKDLISKRWQMVRYDEGVDLSKQTEAQKEALQQMYISNARQSYLDLKKDGTCEYKMAYAPKNQGTWRISEDNSQLELLPDGVSKPLTFVIEYLTSDELTLNRKVNQLTERMSYKIAN